MLIYFWLLNRCLWISVHILSNAPPMFTNVVKKKKLAILSTSQILHVNILFIQSQPVKVIYLVFVCCVDLTNNLCIICLFLQYVKVAKWNSSTVNVHKCLLIISTFMSSHVNGKMCPKWPEFNLFPHLYKPLIDRLFMFLQYPI